MTVPPRLLSNLAASLRGRALKIVGPESSFAPDLVISGANFGENLSDSITHSGTVMNVLFAARRGVPGIALSVGVDFAEARTGFGSTVAAFPKAGAFLARVIASLEATRAAGQPLLPVAHPLSINYPVVGGGTPAGVRLTTPGRVDSFTTGYKRVYTAPGRLERCCGLVVQVAIRVSAGRSRDMARDSRQVRARRGHHTLALRRGTCNRTHAKEPLPAYDPPRPDPLLVAVTAHCLHPRGHVVAAVGPMADGTAQRELTCGAR